MSEVIQKQGTQSYHIKSSQSEEGDSRGQNRSRGDPFLALEALKSERGPWAGQVCPGVTVIVGGVVLKLQLFCRRSEHRLNDENMRGQEPGHGEWKRQLLEEMHGHSDRFREFPEHWGLFVLWVLSRDKFYRFAYFASYFFYSAVIFSILKNNVIIKGILYAAKVLRVFQGTTWILKS